MIHFQVIYNCEVKVNVKKQFKYFLNKSWSQHPSKQQLYGHLPPILQTIQVRQIRYRGHCLTKKKTNLTKHILSWTPTYGHTSVC